MNPPQLCWTVSLYEVLGPGQCGVAGKPLVIGEFGSQRPMDIRNGFYKAVYDELAKAKSEGLPAAGALPGS